MSVFPGASGLECEWQSIFKDDPNFVLLSCITLPWACRKIKFGQGAQVLGTKHQIEVGIKSSITPDDKDTDDIKGDDKDINSENTVYIKQVSDIIGIPPDIIDFGNILNMTLTAKCAVIHPTVMYWRWKDYDGTPLDERALFYQGINFMIYIFFQIQSEYICILYIYYH